jgi:hypothetical protein
MPVDYRPSEMPSLYVPIAPGRVTITRYWPAATPLTDALPHVAPDDTTTPDASLTNRQSTRPSDAEHFENASLSVPEAVVEKT